MSPPGRATPSAGKRLNHDIKLAFTLDLQLTMWLTRSLFRECRPFFRVLEEQSRLAPPALYNSSRFSRRWSPWVWNNQTPVDISDKGDSFLVEADLPGVKRENLEVKVGDRGKSLLIEGKVMNKLREKAQQGMCCTSFCVGD